jgi:hypothetical protein
MKQKNNDFLDKLDEMQETYQTAKRQAEINSGGAPLPDGEYIVKIVKAILTESKTSGLPMIKREFIITKGEYKGIQLWDNLVLNEYGMVKLARWFEICGLSQLLPEQLRALSQALDDICSYDYLLKVRVESGDFLNVTPIEVIGEIRESKIPFDKPEKKEVYSKPAIKTKKIIDTESEEEDKPDSSNSDIDSMTRQELKEYIVNSDNEQVSSIRVTTKMTDDGIRSLIKGALESEFKSESESDSLREELILFCENNNIDYDDDYDIENFKNVISKKKLKKSTLTDEEIETLEKIGL